MLKVASYNIRKCIGTDRIRRPDRILDVLREIDADIVALQEADRRFGVRPAALPHTLIDHSPWAAVPLNRGDHSLGWHGNAILVRRGAAVRDCGHIDLPTVEPRGAVFADIDIDGVALRIVGMHLDLSGLRRRQQARAIIAALATRAPRPTILMGDLNEWTPNGGVLREFSGSYRIAITGPSFHSRRPVARLDRIMADRGIAIVRSGVHDSLLARRASDHLPVWARMAFDAATG